MTAIFYYTALIHSIGVANFLALTLMLSRGFARVKLPARGANGLSRQLSGERHAGLDCR
jgi:hypothetical protein